MTLFGIIWMGLILWAFLQEDIRPMLKLTLLGMIWQCSNVFVLGNGLSSGPQLITSAAFLCKSLFYRRGFIISAPYRCELPWVLLLLYIPVNVYLIHPDAASGKLLGIIQISIYILTFFQIHNFARYVDRSFIRECILMITRFVVIIGFIQLGIEILRIPKNNIIATLVYNDSTNRNICYYNKNVVRMYSTFMEPSYCAAILVGLLFYFVFDKEILPGNKRIAVIALLSVCVALTFSSTAYGAFVLLFAFYFIIYSDRRTTWKIAIAGIAVLFILILGTDVLNTVIFNKFSSGSGLVRSRMNMRAWSKFSSSIWTGVGYDSSRGSSIALTLLSELGLIGFVPYFVFGLQMLRYSVAERETESTQLLGTVYMVLAAILSQVIACPDLDLCTSWLAMYFFALAFGVKEQEDLCAN